MAASCEESHLIKKIMNIHQTLVPLPLITYSEWFGRQRWRERSHSTPTQRQLNKTQAGNVPTRRAISARTCRLIYRLCVCLCRCVCKKREEGTGVEPRHLNVKGSTCFQHLRHLDTTSMKNSFFGGGEITDSYLFVVDLLSLVSYC